MENGQESFVIPPASAQVRAWQRHDGLGTEYFTLSRLDGGWSLEGRVILVHGGRPCSIDYRVGCDDMFETRSCRIVAAVSGRPQQLELRREDLLGCTDVDLEFTPSTNMLPICRLDLEVGQTARIACAWVRFPALNLERLEQTYTRVSETRYRYQSGSFQADVEVDEWGLVCDYSNGWHAIAAVDDQG